MTKQEILDYLNQYRNAGNHIHREAMDAAIEAFEKQMPKKPIKSYSLKCPVCGNEVFSYDISKQKFCSECGQAIDWCEKGHKDALSDWFCADGERK